ncbi:TIGR02391 family protein [Propionicicella superfundia]|uniref:TIGR02391 family protein n=1 Tax=Propionicicella superfundia TaxID=348582 RepID=UPI0006858554|nr:TIGR02391 family protein [Propionicicella superfundia]
MDPKTNLEYLDFLSRHLQEFIAVFDEFMTLHVENTGPNALALGIAPAVFERDGADAGRVKELTAELHRLSGTLMDLSEVTSIYMTVQGAGTIDPFMNWATMLQPKPLLEASNVRGCAVQAAGRLQGLRAKAEALAAPSLDPVRLHPLVWAAACRLWNDGHLRQAVAAAGEAVTGQMKQLTGRNDSADTSLWQQAFSASSPEAGKPRLRWPGDPVDQDVRTMNDGLRQFAPGANMVIRNPATHVDEALTEQDALERLATLSVLARLIDSCAVVSVSAGERTSAV